LAFVVLPVDFVVVFEVLDFEVLDPPDFPPDLPVICSW
jgi:hypothetical protein